MHIWYFIVAAVIAILPIIFIYKKEKSKGHKYFWIPLICRWLAYTLLLNLIIQPSFLKVKYKEQPASLIVLIDSSASMDVALKHNNQHYAGIIDALQDKLGNQIALDVHYFTDGIILDTASNKNVTDIGKSIQDALQIKKQAATKGVLVISDGINNQGTDPRELSRYSTLPIYSLGVGDSSQIMDLKINKIYANKTVSANSVFEVIVDIAKYKINQSNINVALLLNGKSIINKNITNDAQLLVQQIAFQLEAPKPGIYNYEIQLPIIPGEKNTNNNSQSFRIEVSDEALEVLIWQQSPHPDVSAIKNSLEQSAIHKVTIHTGNSLPENVDKYALLILHNTPHVAFAQNNTIKDKPKWYIVGLQSNINWLNQHQKFVRGIPQNVIHTIFPNYNNLFSVFQQPDNTAAILESLPPLSGVYYDASQVSKSDVLVFQKVGNVVTNTPLWFFNLNQTNEAYTLGEGLWRWKIHEYKNKQNTDVADNLIQQTVNSLAIKNDDRPFKLFVDENYLTESQPVMLQATLKNAAGKLINSVSVSLQVTDDSGKLWKIEMDPFGSGYKANLGKLAAGNYAALAQCRIGNNNFSAHISFNVNSVSLEAINTVADHRLLYDIAHLSTGAFFNVQQLDELIKTIQRDNRFVTVIEEEKVHQKLIDYKWIFFLLLGICTIEWACRKYWQS